MFGLLVLGLALVAGPHYLFHSGYDTGLAGEIAGHLGIAFLISGILGLTVEQFTKEEFIRELGANVFKATVGYTLPEELQGEMRWLAEQKSLCVEHFQQVNVVRIDETTVEVTCEIMRKIKNISHKSIKETVGVGIDEWFATRPSRIHEFAYQLGGGKRIEVQSSKLNHPKIQKGRPVLAMDAPKVKIAPQEIITVWMKYSEVKPSNSDTNIHFSKTTINPRVSVHSPSDIIAEVAFPREDGTNKERFSSTYSYSGSVLTGQEIRVRWWEEADLNAWLKTSPDANGRRRGSSA